MTVNKVVELARTLVGVAKWKWGAKPEEAPAFFDCSSLIQWLYRQNGIGLPRRAVRQAVALRVLGKPEDGYPRRYKLTEARAGDVLFVSSPYAKGVRTEEDNNVHACLVTGDGTVICATNSELGYGVVEISIDHLLKTRRYRGIGRIEDL